MKKLLFLLHFAALATQGAEPNVEEKIAAAVSRHPLVEDKQKFQATREILAEVHTSNTNMLSLQREHSEALRAVDLEAAKRIEGRMITLERQKVLEQRPDLRGYLDARMGFNAELAKLLKEYNRDSENKLKLLTKLVAVNNGITTGEARDKILTNRPALKRTK